jgi:hypothetical protein
MKKTLFTITVLLLALWVSFTQAEPRRLVLEYCTGTWCPWCPCGKTAALEILAAYPNSMVIAYHGGSSDPWSYFNGYAIRSMLGFAAYPTGIVDRMNHPGNGSSYPYITYDMWMGLAQTRYNTSGTTQINVAVTGNTYNSGTRQLTTNVCATALQTLTGQYKIVYVLTEDNVIYPQSGNGTCPGGSDYVHKWIARSVLNDPNGENLNTGTWNQNQTITKTITTTLDASWVATNCNVQIIVYKDSSAGLMFSTVEQGTKQGVTVPVGVSSNTGEVPEEYSLSQNYPNPFNPVTHVQFSIPKSGNVTLKIYDMVGNLVAVYLDQYITAGIYNAEIDGSSWASGVYFYTLSTSDFTQTKKMTLVK